MFGWVACEWRRKQYNKTYQLGPEEITEALLDKGPGLQIELQFADERIKRRSRLNALLDRKPPGSRP